jgi:F420H(2)-dependent quinone reductase
VNLWANPRVSIRLGKETRTIIARTTQGTERARLWERVVRHYPVAAGYQRTPPVGCERPRGYRRPANARREATDELAAD